MRRILKPLIFSVITFILFFGSLEGLSSVLFAKPGASDFIERRILEQGLSIKKPKDEIRIFFFGESTIHGDALYPRSTIDRWVKVYLEDLLKNGGKKVRLYNFGRLGCNSHFILQSFRETLPYDPDLVVFYTAHNDFVQLDNRHSNFDPKPLRFGQKGFFQQEARNVIKNSAFLSAVNRLHVWNKIRRHRIRDEKRASVTELPLIERREKTYNPEYDAITHDSPVFKTILRRWRWNVQAILRETKAKDIRLIFVSVVSNLKDYSPNESRNTPMDPERLSRWQSAYDAGIHAAEAGDHRFAADRFRTCLRLDQGHALTYYRLARCYEALGAYRRAKRCYVLANDKDLVPLRAPSEVGKVYDTLLAMRLPGVSVIPTQKVIEAKQKNGIIDSDYLLDTMHPSVDGQAVIALEIVKTLHDISFIPEELWQWDKLKSVEELKGRFDLDDNFQFQLYMQKACYVGHFYDKAIEYSRKALEIKPGSVDAKRSLAWAYWRKGDSEKAAQIYDDLMQSARPQMEEVFRTNPDLLRFMNARGRRKMPVAIL